MSWANRPTNWDAPGQVELGEDKQKILDQIEFLTSPPMAVLRRVAAFSVANSAVTAIDMDTVVTDNYNGFSVSSPSRYTVSVAGYYLLTGGIGWVANATGIRTAQWSVSGTGVPGSQGKVTAVGGGIGTGIPARGVIVQAAVGDYFELVGFQNSGGTLNTDTSGAESYPSMSIVWKGSA